MEVPLPQEPPRVEGLQLQEVVPLGDRQLTEELLLATDAAPVVAGSEAPQL